MSSVNINVKFDLDQIAKEIARQHRRAEVLTFLEQLDEQMNSWDFTQKAAELFVRTGLTLDEGMNSEEMMAKASLARVAEFLRQSRLQPHVQALHPISSIWTDPTATLAPLNAADLAKLIELAMISLPTQAPA